MIGVSASGGPGRQPRDASCPRRTAASEFCRCSRLGLPAGRVIRDGVVPGVLRVLFVAYVLATAVHIGLVVAHEPFAFDAWNIAQDTRAEPFSFSRFLDYGTGQYLSSNPRVGQWFAYLAYKLEYFAVVATPLAYLALALAVTILGLGRWP